MLTRRSFIEGAAAIGATLVWAGPAEASRRRWVERRDLYPEGVASGDPEADSIILWTRRPAEEGKRITLTVEVAVDPEFQQVVATARAPALAESDWTCRVLVGGLKASTVYWYRFIDEEGNGSRIGRTLTAPHHDDARAVRFAFVSCQSVNEG